MGKALVSEVLGILRQFEIAGELTPRKSISKLKETNPRSNARLVSLLFERTPYYIIIDPTAEDDTGYLLDLIQTDAPETRGRFIKNPNDNASYGLRHKFKDIYLFEVRAVKHRLDIELTKRYPDLSRSTIQKYIKLGYVKVNDETVKTSKLEVTENDDIALTPPEKQDTSDKSLPIIYIDDEVIVVNKPSGILTHSKGALNDEFTVADFFRRYTTNGLETSRPGIVHRLDRDTSGVIIGARTNEAAATLKKQFSDRTVKKRYTAVLEGIPKLEKALIDLPIGRNPSKPSTFRVDPKGKPAITEYEVTGTGNNRSLVEMRPKTGRTHQLRVHMQYLKTPIVGDRVYGLNANPRLCLHAYSLEITIPNSQRKVFTAQTPPLFKELIKE